MGKIVLTSIFLLTLLCFPASAITIRGIPFEGAFHLGLVMGPGAGINFGLDAYMPFEDWRFGGEIEQIISDYEFEVNINATRLGGVIKYKFFEETMALGLHLGKIFFKTTKDVVYTDAFSNNKYEIKGERGYSATYIEAAASFKILEEFILTPKIILNYVDDGGAIKEVDLNIGHEF